MNHQYTSHLFRKPALILLAGLHMFFSAQALHAQDSSAKFPPDVSRLVTGSKQLLLEGRRAARPASNPSPVTADTLLPNTGFLDCDFVLYMSDTGGYVAGTNGYGDLEKVQYFETTDSLKISELLIWFAVAEMATSPGDITAVLYNAVITDSTNLDSIRPGELLASATLSMAELDTCQLDSCQIDTSGFPVLTSIAFDDSVHLKGPFFAGIRMSQVPGDTVAIWTSKSWCNLRSLAWEKWSDSTWIRIAPAWSELRVDLGILPVVTMVDTTIVTGIQIDAGLPGGFELSQNFPNPFNPTTEFGFRISDFGSVRIYIYDIRGRMVKAVINAEMHPGSYTASWDGTNDFGQPVASGIYFYRLTVHCALRTPHSAFEITRKMVLLR